MDALFKVDKPKGPTSFDVVARIRRASGVKRVGHAGTLDPLATGVLVVAVGQATRLLEYFADFDKAYRAEVTFGVTTTTYDAEGEVVERRPVDRLTSGGVQDALAPFRGRIAQRPPAYSAVSVGGKRLYDLARRGQAVAAPLREVEISRLVLERWLPPVATLLVECSKGTYIRSLAHDLGATLGSGGYLSGLVRLRVGPFSLERAGTLPDLEEALRAGDWQRYATPLGEALAHLPSVEIDADAARRLSDGVAVDLDSGPSDTVNDLVRVYTPDGRLLAIGRRMAEGGRVVLRAKKVLGGTEITGGHVRDVAGGSGRVATA